MNSKASAIVTSITGALSVGLVDEWPRRLNDVKGQSVTITKLLLPELRGTCLGGSRGGGDAEKRQPEGSKFRISVEISKVTDCGVRTG